MTDLRIIPSDLTWGMAELFDPVDDLARSREEMLGAGDILDIIHIIQEPITGKLGIDQPYQQSVIFFFEPMLPGVKLGDTDKTVGAGKKRVEQKQPDKNDQPQKNLSADSYICVGQPLGHILPKRFEKRFLAFFALLTRHPCQTFPSRFSCRTYTISFFKP